MALEIERKFLVTGAFPQDPAAQHLVQAYVAREDGRNVRVRFNGARYTLTIKGPTEGIARQEYEIDITEDIGKSLLFDLCPVRIDKMRHTIAQGSLNWEIDVFSGANAGLIIAEIELPSASSTFDVPSWLGPEVSEDQRFFNANLLDAPFCSWGLSYAQLCAQVAA